MTEKYASVCNDKVAGLIPPTRTAKLTARCEITSLICNKVKPCDYPRIVELKTHFALKSKGAGVW